MFETAFLLASAIINIISKTLESVVCSVITCEQVVMVATLAPRATKTSWGPASPTTTTVAATVFAPYEVLVIIELLKYTVLAGFFAGWLLIGIRITAALPPASLSPLTTPFIWRFFSPTLYPPAPPAPVPELSLTLYPPVSLSPVLPPLPASPELLPLPASPLSSAELLLLAFESPVLSPTEVSSPVPSLPLSPILSTASFSLASFSPVSSSSNTAATTTEPVETVLSAKVEPAITAEAEPKTDFSSEPSLSPVSSSSNTAATSTNITTEPDETVLSSTVEPAITAEAEFMTVTTEPAELVLSTSVEPAITAEAEAMTVTATTKTTEPAQPVMSTSVEPAINAEAEAKTEPEQKKKKPRHRAGKKRGACYREKYARDMFEQLPKLGLEEDSTEE